MCVCVYVSITYIYIYILFWTTELKIIAQFWEEIILYYYYSYIRDFPQTCAHDTDSLSVKEKAFRAA